jgi:hypothetical protein
MKIFTYANVLIYFFPVVFCGKNGDSQNEGLR